MFRIRPPPVVVVLAALSLPAAGCRSATSTGGGGTGPTSGLHTVHLQGSAFTTGAACSDCHAPEGFGVDFSQNALLHAHGATFDPTTQTCSSVYCHGTFTFDGVNGAAPTVAWNDPTPLACDSCHSMPPANHLPIAAGAGAASCNACHADTVNPDGTINLSTGAHIDGKAQFTGGTCSSCHGTPGRTGSRPGTDPQIAAAPPAAPLGSPSYAVGAHLAHLDPAAATAMAPPVACAECHAVPTDARHATSPPAQKVVFGPLASSGGATPSWVAGTAGCAASYCHGNFTLAGVSGSDATPTWTDATPLTCTSCHGMPPAGHPPLSGTVTAATCNACHPASVDPQGRIVPGGAHLNGTAETSQLGCTTCHGDARRAASMAGSDPNLVSAPPVAPPGAPPYAVGAHLGHLNPDPATAPRGPLACAECHVVPADSTHANHPPSVKVAFGSLARTGGAAPTWVAGTAGCAASYCHGNFTYGSVNGASATPLWTDATPLGCTSCHGMPPAGHLALPAPVTAASCSSCHPRAINPDGSVNLVDGGHLNGAADTAALGCTACHGDASRVGTLPGTDPNLASAPPVAPVGAPPFAVGAHRGHVDPIASSYLMPPVPCAECHVVPTDAGHATNPPAQIVVFGNLSRTGGASPTWDAGTAGCAASYCHGNFAFGPVTGTSAVPTWTDATPLTCTSCHGMPPTGHPALTVTPTAASCFSCHPQSVNADGTIVQGGGHMNGRADGGDCTSCHGQPPATGRHREEEHVRLRCDACHPTGYTTTTAVAPFHENGVVDLGAQAGYSCGRTGCPQGVTGSCINSCHTRPQDW